MLDLLHLFDHGPDAQLSLGDGLVLGEEASFPLIEQFLSFPVKGRLQIGLRAGCTEECPVPLDFAVDAVWVIDDVEKVGLDAFAANLLAASGATDRPT